MSDPQINAPIEAETRVLGRNTSEEIIFRRVLAPGTNVEITIGNQTVHIRPLALSRAVAAVLIEPEEE